MPTETLKVKSNRIAPSLRSSVPNLSAEDLLAAWLIPGPVRAAPPTGLQAVLFDLDGVLVDTAEFHYLAWQRLADELRIPFNRRRNEAFRGVGRMECLDKLLGEHARSFVLEEKNLLADRKNQYYLHMIEGLTARDLAPGTSSLIMQLRAAGIRLALVSASRNAPRVLALLGITSWFDAIVDGSQVTRGKPDPQSFFLAADRLHIDPRACVVVEDADAGILAARAAEMRTVAIADAASHAAELADLAVPAMSQLTFDILARLVPTATPRTSAA